MAEDANSGEDDNALKSVAGKLSSGSSIMDTAGAAGSLQKLMALREEAAAPIALAIMAEGKKVLEDVPRASSEALTEAARTGGRYGTAIAVLGVYNGATEFAQAYKKGDLTGQFVSAADTGMGLTNVGIQTAAAMGKEMSPLLEGGAKLGGTVVLVAQAVKSIYDADGTFLDRDAGGNVTGLGNKGEVTVKESLKIGTGLGIAAATTATVGTAGLIAVAAPVVVAGVAVYAIDKTSEEAIAANNAWKELDHQIERDGAAKRTGPVNSGVRISDDPNRPDIRDYKHLLAETVRVSADIPDSKIAGGTLTRRDGLIQATPPNAKILSDPRNLPVIESALNKRAQDQTLIQKTNDQSTPLLLRWSKESLDKTQRYETAKSDAARFAT